METNKGFISVSDYAKLRGVSVAAVYKRLGGSLKPYYKEIDGKKFLSVDVLEAEGIKPVEKGIQPGIKPQEAQEHLGAGHIVLAHVHETNRTVNLVHVAVVLIQENNAGGGSLCGFVGQ